MGETIRRSCSQRGRCPRSAADRSGAGVHLGGRFDLAQEVSGGEEVAEGLTVGLTGEPGLATFGRVDLGVVPQQRPRGGLLASLGRTSQLFTRSEEHTSELQSLMRISYAVFCLTKKKRK